MNHKLVGSVVFFVVIGLASFLFLNAKTTKADYLLDYNYSLIGFGSYSPPFSVYSSPASLYNATRRTAFRIVPNVAIPTNWKLQIYAKRTSTPQWLNVSLVTDDHGVPNKTIVETQQNASVIGTTNAWVAMSNFTTALTAGQAYWLVFYENNVTGGNSGRTYTISYDEASYPSYQYAMTTTNWNANPVVWTQRGSPYLVIDATNKASAVVLDSSAGWLDLQLWSGYDTWACQSFQPSQTFQAKTIWFWSGTTANASLPTGLLYVDVLSSSCTGTILASTSMNFSNFVNGVNNGEPSFQGWFPVELPTYYTFNAGTVYYIRFNSTGDTTFNYQLRVSKTSTYAGGFGGTASRAYDSGNTYVPTAYYDAGLGFSNTYIYKNPSNYWLQGNETGGGTTFDIVSDGTPTSQSFTANQSLTVDGVYFSMVSSNPPHNYTLSIWSSTGTCPACKPNAILASGIATHKEGLYTGSSEGENWKNTIFARFTANLSLTSGTRYWVVFNNTDPSGSKYWNVTGNTGILWAKQNVTPFDNEYHCTWSLGAWCTSADAKHLFFALEATAPATFASNTTNTTTAGAPAKISIYATEYVGLDSYIFSFDNCAGTLTNDSAVKFATVRTAINPWSEITLNQWANVSKTLSASIGCTVRYQYFTNNTVGTWTGSSIYQFATTSAVVGQTITLDSITIAPSGVIQPTEGGLTSMNVTVNITNSTTIDKCLVYIFNSTDTYPTTVSKSYTGTIQKTGSTIQCYQAWNMEYWRNTGTWNVSAKVNLTTAENNFTSATFTYNGLTSLTINSTYITFSGTAGQTGLHSTDAYPMSLNNTGNTKFNITISGNDLTLNGNIIKVGNVTYCDTEGGSYTAITGSAVQITAMNNLNPEEKRYIYFRGNVPTGFTAGDYTGTISLTAVVA